MDRTLSLEFARVVEAAALRSGRLLGRGQKDAADGLAVDAMRQAFDSVRISGTEMCIRDSSTTTLILQGILPKICNESTRGKL